MIAAMRGKIAIVVMLSLALAAAGFAWSWNYRRSARARTFWGPKAATISGAERVEAFRIVSDDEGAGEIDWLGKTLPIEQPVDLSRSPGLIHARTAGLMGDEAFDWSTQSPASEPQWTTGVRFRRGNDTATILFDFTTRQIALVEAGKAANLSKKSASGWQDYLERRAFGEQGHQSARKSP